MSSIGVRIGSYVMNKEIIENRRQKQVWMKRQCEGCLKTEVQFGEFMMCAGCRKVRYCSKECQVRDWKYHRMSCHFFRPRPGFRSRGTQTSCDASTQTGDDFNTSGNNEHNNHHQNSQSGSQENLHGNGEREEGHSGRVNFSCQTDVSYTVNYTQWKYMVRKDEGTMTTQ